MEWELGLEDEMVIFLLTVAGQDYTANAFHTITDCYFLIFPLLWMKT